MYKKIFILLALISIVSIPFCIRLFIPQKHNSISSTNKIKTHPSPFLRKKHIIPANNIIIDEHLKLRNAVFSPKYSTTPKIIGFHPNSEYKIVITFDDGPNYQYTQKYIDVLKKYNAKATFFVIGKNVERNPQLIKLIADDGFEIGTHSYSHKNMAKMSRQQIENELWRSSMDIYSITKQKVTLFRPPYGAFNNDVKDIAQELGLKIILWNVDSLDWRKTDYKTIVNRVEKNTHSGSIILMHEGHKNTLEALPLILHDLQSKGYKFVTVSDLLATP